MSERLTGPLDPNARAAFLQGLNPSYAQLLDKPELADWFVSVAELAYEPGKRDAFEAKIKAGLLARSAPLDMDALGLRVSWQQTPQEISALIGKPLTIPIIYFSAQHNINQALGDIHGSAVPIYVGPNDEPLYVGFLPDNSHGFSASYLKRLLLHESTHILHPGAFQLYKTNPGKLIAEAAAGAAEYLETTPSEQDFFSEKADYFKRYIEDQFAGKTIDPATQANIDQANKWLLSFTYNLLKHPLKRDVLCKLMKCQNMSDVEVLFNIVGENVRQTYGVFPSNLFS